MEGEFKAVGCLLPSNRTDSRNAELDATVTDTVGEGPCSGVFKADTAGICRNSANVAQTATAAFKRPSMVQRDESEYHPV